MRRRATAVTSRATAMPCSATRLRCDYGLSCKRALPRRHPRRRRQLLVQPVGHQTVARFVEVRVVELERACPTLQCVGNWSGRIEVTQTQAIADRTNLGGEFARGADPKSAAARQDHHDERDTPPTQLVA